MMTLADLMCSIGRCTLDYHPDDLIPWTAGVFVEKPRKNDLGCKWIYTQGRTPEEALLSGILLLGANIVHHELLEMCTAYGESKKDSDYTADDVDKYHDKRS